MSRIELPLIGWKPTFLPLKYIRIEMKKQYVRLRPTIQELLASQAIDYRHLTVFIKCGSYEIPCIALGMLQSLTWWNATVPRLFNISHLSFTLAEDVFVILPSITACDGRPTGYSDLFFVQVNFYFGYATIKSICRSNSHLLDWKQYPIWAGNPSLSKNETFKMQWMSFRHYAHWVWLPIHIVI